MKMLLAAGRLKGFRACLGSARRTAEGIALARETAELLQVGVGDTILATAR